MQGNGRGLIEIYLGILLQEQREMTQTSVMTAGVPSEIRTGHPTKASLQSCRSVSTARLSLWLLRTAGRYINNSL
jgi:hypothetical protein